MKENDQPPCMSTNARLQVEIKFASHTYTATVIEAGQLTRFLATKSESFTFGAITGTAPEGVKEEIARLTLKPAPVKARKPINRFKTSDIRIASDSQGYMTATHKYQGLLIDSSYFDNRAECRREAVQVMREIQTTGKAPWEAY